ncbi:immunity 7 family protein [Amycolatopsis sp. NBC_01488]|uniref:Imm7 family immunity protein n=1 Tax=Amycolatopsis sp. NBC_01488 TaxID=2903563 RepID=UPI002E2DC4E2|nr:Imm7 family immunity protein [Amycolatopsis sp. NBC_01488]
MYEFHGWFGLAETPEEIEAARFDESMNVLRQRVSAIDWASGEVQLRVFNGLHFLTVDGAPNRRRDEARELTELLEHVAREFRGSWGVLYERSDDMDSPPGPGAFRVRVMARGKISERLDPFLSPVRPIIED